MENLRNGAPSVNGGNGKNAETSFQENSAEYAEFINWKTRRAAQAAADEAERHEAECQLEREKVASEVYAHQVRRARRAFTRAARAALVGGALTAAVVWGVALLADAYKEE
jgi:predicted TIM-barrel fold metal-dependent hydrolase